MSSLRDLNDIPVKYRSIFSSIHKFNRVQSDVFDDVFKTNKHIVVSAPTGSGKTAIFELAIVKLLMSLEQTNCNIESAKIVYVAPTKALCNEIFRKWHEKFSAVGLKVALVTGDSDPTEMSDLNDLSSYQIAVTTPEKWDAMTRKWKEHYEIASAVRLVLIDEVHLVGDTSRGPTLEAIVSRIKTFPQNQSDKGRTRFISVSASLPNIEDVAKWISAKHPNNDSVRTLKIEESQRPIRLERFVYGFIPPTNSFLFNNILTSELIKILNKILIELSSNGKQILIFCPTRNDVESSLDRLLKEGQLLNKVQLTRAQRSILEDVCERIEDDKLRSSVKVGLAYHHAGVSYNDREHIENAYRSGAIKILLSTNTLAMGVNLPAHTVIIKSTEHYTNGSNEEIPDSMILQMMGRAGRQQYYTTGRVYIMTTANKTEFYEKLAEGTVQIESHLEKKLAEFLNVEIALNTISDSDASIMQWLRTTFLYARTTAKLMMMTENKIQAELKDMCKRAIADLQRSKAIEQKPDGSLLSLPFGAIMTKYFLSIPTIGAFQGLRGCETISDLLDKIVNCNEFMDIYLRKNEKKTLNDLNRLIRFPIPSTIQTVPQKVSCLLQAFLGGKHIDNTALLMDLRRIVQTTERMASSLIDFFQCDQFTSECFQSMLSATILIKSLRTHTWADLDIFSELNISKQNADKLIKSGINTVDALMKINAREIEDILTKEIPYGNELLDAAAKKFPCYAVNVDVMAGSWLINVRVTQTNFQYVYQPTAALTLLIGDSCNNLICCEDIQPALNEIGYYEKLLTLEPEAVAGHVHVINHSLVGADQMVEFSFNEQKTPEKIPNKNVLPAKSSLARVASKSKKAFVPKTPSDKSSKSTGKQSTLSQYFGSKEKAPNQNNETPKRTSVFDTKNRVEAPRKLIFSPDLFPTPVEPTQKPEHLYDFSYVPSSINCLPPNRADNVYINQSNAVNQTPCLPETQIQDKIRQRRIEQGGVMDDFVTANAIFNNKPINEKPADVQKPLLIHRKNRSCVDNIDSFFECDDIEDNVLQIMEQLDNPNSVNCQRETKGLGNSAMHKNDASKTIQTILNLDVKIIPPEAIRNDFEDSDEWLNQVEMPQACQQNQSTELSPEFWNEFFSTDSRSDDLGEEANTDEPPAKRVALDNVHEKISAVLGAPPSKQTTPSPNRQQPSKSVVNASQASTSSNKAVCGSPKQNGPASEPENHLSRGPQPSITRMAVSEFEYKLPPKMSSNTIRQNYMKRSGNCTEVEPVVQKKPKLIDDLLRNGAKKSNEYEQKIQSLRNGSLKQQPVGKTSLKQIFTRIPLNDAKPDLNADMMIKKCQERLKTDDNYKQKDYDLDYCRLKILKITPPKSEPKTNLTDTMFGLDDMTHISFDDNMYNFVTPQSRSSVFNV